MAKLMNTASALPLFLLLLAGVSSAALIKLDEDNWDTMLEGEWMVEFYAPWCPACKALDPIWREFASWSNDLDINVGQVDVTESPGLSGRFMVTALPTIYHVKDGVFRQYRGSRSKEHFLSFVEEKKWMDAEEVPAWKSPGSYQMSIIAQFFKLSMVLRSVHSSLIKDYGIPEYGSYLIFALCTILVGAIIGLLLVCVIDLLFPPKQGTPRMATAIQDQEEDLLEEQETKEEPTGTESQQEEEAENSQQSQEEESDGTDKPSALRKRKARKAD